MGNVLDLKTLVIALPDTASDWQGDDKVANIFKAPSAALGGAIKIVRAYAVNQAATGAGTGFSLTLLNYGTAGTAVAGTVSSELGGTGDPWAAGTPKAFTISDGDLDADEWLVLRKDETNSSDPSRCMVVIQYLHGN